MINPIFITDVQHVWVIFKLWVSFSRVEWQSPSEIFWFEFILNVLNIFNEVLSKDLVDQHGILENFVWIIRMNLMIVRQDNYKFTIPLVILVRNISIKKLLFIWHHLVRSFKRSLTELFIRIFIDVLFLEDTLNRWINALCIVIDEAKNLNESSRRNR